MLMKKGAVPPAKSLVPAGSLMQPEDGMWMPPRSTSTCPGQSNPESSPYKEAAEESLLYARNLISHKKGVSNRQFAL